MWLIDYNTIVVIALSIIRKLHLKNSILKILLIACAIGLTSTSISIGKSYVFKVEIKSFTSFPLETEQEHSVEVLKAKIESLERVNAIKDELYSQIMTVNEFSLIVACIIFNLFLLVQVYKLFFNKSDEFNQ